MSLSVVTSLTAPLSNAVEAMVPYLYCFCCPGVIAWLQARREVETLTVLFMIWRWKWWDEQLRMV